jgi:expansin (peptidoglycan-binding protein)
VVARPEGSAGVGRRRSVGAWLAAGGGVVLAAVVGVALVLQNSGGAACAAPAAAAAPPVGDAVHTGKATFYTPAGATGNCSFVGFPADDLYVALSPGEYADAAACGGYLDVTGPDGKVRVKVVDQCPECPAGHIDLSRKAFARIADPVRGVVPVTYRAVRSPRLPGPLAFRIKEGASQWWFAVLVIDHGTPLRTVEVRPAGGGWQRISRTDYNYWLRDSGLGQGPYAIRVTDVYGRRATVTGIRMSPEKVQRTNVFMYGGSGGRPAPEQARATPQPTPAAPRPTATASPASMPTTARPPVDGVAARAGAKSIPSEKQFCR